MIRRDVQLPDGSPGWLLVSQVDHARLSGVLASHCARPLPIADSNDAFRAQLLDAIAGHDDGWAEWEVAPSLDPSDGRPLAFNELPTAEATEIWSRSIEEARCRSAVGGWLVAGHFLRLLEMSDDMRDDPAGVDWKNAYVARRSRWFEEWTAEFRLHPTSDQAAQLLEWQWVFDAASLWLCLHGPLPGTNDDAERWLLDEQGALRSQWSAPGMPRPAPWGASIAVRAEPWIFTISSLALTCPALVVPRARYVDGQTLLANAARIELAFEIQPS
ncbi:MAG: DUF3891 family protein [Planctomycetales bacterium]|nr:DUF3891 family protein [Planctomycetales bacterium]